MGKVITVVSGKGGVGKTTVSCFIADCLAKNSKVVAVDGDLGLSNLDIALGVADRIVYDIADVCERKCTVDKALVKSASGVYYLSAGNNIELSETAEANLGLLIRTLAGFFDYVIIDSPAGITKASLRYSEYADTVLVVTEPAENAIKDAEKTAMLIREKAEEKDLFLVINKIDKKLINKKLLPDVDKIIDSVAVKVIGLIPADSRVTTIHSKQLFESDLDKVKNQVEDICKRLSGKYVPMRRL